MKRIGNDLVIGLIAGSVMGYRSWRSSKDAKATLSDEALQKTLVERRDVEKVVHARGEIKAPLTTEVKSEVNGMVVKVYVSAGDSVKKGDVLVELDKSELESQLNEAEHQIQASRLKMEQTKLDLGRE